MPSRFALPAPSFLGALLILLTAGCYTVPAGRPTATPPSAREEAVVDDDASIDDDEVVVDDLDQAIDPDTIYADEDEAPIEVPDSHSRPTQIGDDALLLGGIRCRFVIHSSAVREGERLQAWFQFENPWLDAGRVDLSEPAMAEYVIRDVRGRHAVGRPLLRRVRPPSNVSAWDFDRRRNHGADPYDTGVPHYGELWIPPQGELFAPVPIVLRDYHGNDLPPGRYRLSVTLLSREEPRFDFEVTVD